MSDLMRLEAKHRLEEIAERFGQSLMDSGAEFLRMPCDEAAARAAGLDVEEGHLLLAIDGSLSVDTVEDRLQAYFHRCVVSQPERYLGRPERGFSIPSQGTFPESAAWLERFYGEGFLPREKKPAVVDLARCQGPYLRSVDREPLQIIDAASQIASLPAGFRPDAVQAALDEGRFDGHLTAAVAPEDNALEAALLSVASPGLRYVTYANGGAESVEKALHLARRYGTGGRRVVAFEGSFHGRTLLSLFSTWNPVKREPYQLPGFETAFVPFPSAGDVHADPVLPEGWTQAWSERDGHRAFEGEALLQEEIASLRGVEAQLAAGDACAVIVEPYQCEGGDRGATRRFFHGLRALTRAYGVPLVFDEVQAGFGLGGPFFWHRRFWLTDASGQPDGPDLVVCAKRAQLGVVLSRWPDPYPTSIHTASKVRGAIHAEIVRPGLTHQDYADQALTALAGRWPEGLITRTRAIGDAFALDLPTRAIANHLIGQRFYRGYMVYIAGERTLRYRMNRAMTTEDVDRIIGAIEASIDALVQWAGGPGPELFDRMTACTPPAWAPAPVEEKPTSAPVALSALFSEEAGAVADRVLKRHGALSAEGRQAAESLLGLAAGASRRERMSALQDADHAAVEAAAGRPILEVAADFMGTRIRRVGRDEVQALLPAFDALEGEAYEPARRDALTYLQIVAHSEQGIVLVAEDGEGVVGMSFAAPLELWWGMDGPKQDPNRGRKNTLYSADITVAARARGRGLGWRLRRRQVQEALQMDVAFITGRNRVGEAAAMWALNQRLGAYTVAIYRQQYGEEGGRARYYRIPLSRYDRRAYPATSQDADVTDLGSGLLNPVGPAHPALVRARDFGVFDEPAMTKLTVSNFITPGYARYAEYLRHVAPRGCSHLYFTSCQDEMADKMVRILKHKRTAGEIAVSVSGSYFGHTTACARTLTDWTAFHGADPAAMRSPPDEGFFGWPRVPHPNEGARCVAALDALIEQHGAEALLGVFVETVQARTGTALSPAAWAELCAWRDRSGVPLVLSENTTGCYRSGHGAWWLEGVSGDADAVLFWSGGQIGHIFCNEQTYVSKPLSFISTWDGDELSGTRMLRQLYVARDTDVSAVAARLDEGLNRLAHGRVEGYGLYRVLELSERDADRVVDTLERSRIRLQRIGSRRLLICPPVTVDTRDIDRLLQGIREAFR